MPVFRETDTRLRIAVQCVACCMDYLAVSWSTVSPGHTCRVNHEKTPETTCVVSGV